MSADALGLAVDGRNLVSLERRAAQRAPDAIDAAAAHFEALFLGMVLDGMRQTSLGDDSGDMQMYHQMFDRQVAQEISTGRGLGLARLIAEQLRRSAGAGEAPAAPVTPVASTGEGPGAASRADFIREALPHAMRAGRALGVPPLALVAQAALESGWGERLPRRADGSTSFNVFGIKAGGSWSGDRVAARTLESEGGAMVERTAHFRAYADLGAAFDDYARLISTDPRYSKARAGAGDPGRYLVELQAAGYATDPAYADKVGRVLERVMAEVSGA